MGPAESRHATVRPVLLRVTRPASDSTSRCFITAGNDMANGSASSLTDSSLRDKRASSARRVGSDNAAKVRSSSASLNLTMRLSIETRMRMSRTGPHFIETCENTRRRTRHKRHAARRKQGTATRRIEMENNGYTLEQNGKRPALTSLQYNQQTPCKGSSGIQIAQPPR
jgi:hypothetical protein